MAITNQERIGRALELLRDGLRPFVEREMQAAFGEKWIKVAEEGFPSTKLKGGMVFTDPVNLLSILPLGQQLATAPADSRASIHAIADSLLSMRDRSTLAGVFAFCVGALMYYALFYLVLKA